MARAGSSALEAVARAISATHQYRAVFWALSVPLIFGVGLQSSVPVLFLWSTYANFAGDIAAWEAKRRK